VNADTTACNERGSPDPCQSARTYYLQSGQQQHVAAIVVAAAALVAKSPIIIAVRLKILPFIATPLNPRQSIPAQ